MEEKDRRPDKMPIVLPVTRHMRGLEVLKVQQWLNDLNDYYEFNKQEKSVKENSYYDDATIRMVKAFQKFFKLTNSGMYEAKTHDIVEWKFMNMNVNLAKAMERKKQALIMGDSRKW